MTYALETRGLVAGYGSTKILDQLNISVSTGGITALLGANGAGKTTFLRALSHTCNIFSGDIYFNGTKISSLGTNKIVELGVAHVPENRGTFGAFSVLDNLKLAAYTRRDRDLICADIIRVLDIFPQLKTRQSQIAATLSGGEQQMLAIARALMLRPKLLLLDEPSFGLAPLIVEQIFDIIIGISQRSETTILLVEQNARQALMIADYAYVLTSGILTLSGTPSQLEQDERFVASYLGI